MMICLTGAGGKTTLLYALAKRAARQEKHVIVSTTTHIRMPAEGFAPAEDDVRSFWQRGSFAVIGTPCEDGKLCSPGGDALAYWDAAADLLLLEADGAKGLPCKVPAAHEPVIPDQCGRVIGVLGIDALGRPLQEVCFRREEAMRLLGCGPDHRMTEEDLIRIATSSEGLAKGTEGKTYRIVLNKCRVDAFDRTERIKQGIEKRGFPEVICMMSGEPPDRNAAFCKMAESLWG